MKITPIKLSKPIKSNELSDFIKNNYDKINDKETTVELFMYDFAFDNIIKHHQINDNHHTKHKILYFYQNFLPEIIKYIFPNRLTEIHCSIDSYNSKLFLTQKNYGLLIDIVDVYSREDLYNKPFNFKSIIRLKKLREISNHIKNDNNRLLYN